MSGQDSTHNQHNEYNQHNCPVSMRRGLNALFQEIMLSILFRIYSFLTNSSVEEWMDNKRDSDTAHQALKLKSQVRRCPQQQASRHLVGGGPDAGAHESLAYFHYIKYLLGFLIFFLQCFFLVTGRAGRPGTRTVRKGNTKCSIAIEDLILLHNKCMEGQYGKGNIFLFDLYK